ncbi:MAG: Ribosomal RNA small subunit methyltransferase H [Candidatus Roizmanbacteria bacterium GW2011_GWA2_36_23]|uniref:Ribosomal RNA small subunit methyltransferase H n=1 Tax=Candidatus Roizmanbacteria bacterium GW2011_GWA2_36_23 TaxID=1618480 RepID=A0A0G0HDA1_9BACT|nr:MAG: Ribosomal RNA small subunit methyltransferase H [Candidatus Roizmanbacteria bacterium GW2011_GWA2_36_23]
MAHTPVLLKEVINSLNIKTNGLYIDATIGEGGHAGEILNLGGKVLGIDADIQQINALRNIFQAKVRVKELVLIEGNFKDIENIAKENGFFPVDGILFDLGLSMRQLNNSGKGLSYKNSDEPLDMRLSDSIQIQASDLLNKSSESELYGIFSGFSEELNSKMIAESIVRRRNTKKIKKVGDLVIIINRCLKRYDEQVLRRIFQALRIAVNNEFNNLKEALNGSLSLLNQGGRLAVITFHSLEDRIVKNWIKEKQLECVTKKPIVSKNGLRFEKSAKLRVVINKY